MSDAPQPPQIPSVAVNVPSDQEVGVFADFAAIWHTPNTFVLDFLSLAGPMATQQLDPQQPPVPVLSARVASRTRIPAEQVFRIIDGLRAQADQWLAETGRTEPPAGWLPNG